MTPICWCSSVPASAVRATPGQALAATPAKPPVAPRSRLMGTYEVLEGRTVARPVVYRSDAASVRVSLSCAIMEPTAIFPVYVEDEVDSGSSPMWRSLRSKLISCPVSPSYLVPSEQRLVHRSPRRMAHLQGHTRATGGGAAERRAHVERHPSPAPPPHHDSSFWCRTGRDPPV